jgi:DNA-binding GntR family transcriptional regulator
MKEPEKFIPNYEKIQQYVLNKIKSGEYKVGDRIPSENELAQLFSVSRLTANKAIKEMSLMGILERTRGKGTFVSSEQGVSTASKAFVAAVKLTPTGSRNHRLVQFRLIKAFPELAYLAHVSEDELFYELILINKNEGVNESLDYTYISHSRVGDITLSLEFLHSHFIHDYLKTLPNVRPRFLKIFVNTPRYPFLESASYLLKNPEDMSIWSTNVYDANMNLLAITFTTYPSTTQDVPLLTFSL